MGEVKHTPRVTDLIGPAVVGEFYLVPTVKYCWLSDRVAKPYPVLGAKHNDAEHLNFSWEHYHVDGRFLSARDYARAEAWRRPHGGAVVTIEGTPLSRRDFRSWEGVEPFPPVVWLRRKCLRPMHRPMMVRRLGEKLDEHFAGQVCKRGKAGFICPHRGLALGSVEPVDGVITCPLHGLRIDAETGTVLATPQAISKAKGQDNG